MSRGRFLGDAAVLVTILKNFDNLRLFQFQRLEVSKIMKTEDFADFRYVKISKTSKIPKVREIPKNIPNIPRVQIPEILRNIKILNISKAPTILNPGDFKYA